MSDLNSLNLRVLKNIIIGKNLQKIFYIFDK